MYKVARNLLPIAANLWKRKIVQNAICQRCGLRREDVFHALIECEATKKVRKNIISVDDVKMLDH